MSESENLKAFGHSKKCKVSRPGSNEQWENNVKFAKSSPNTNQKPFSSCKSFTKKVNIFVDAKGGWDIYKKSYFPRGLLGLSFQLQLRTKIF